MTIRKTRPEFIPFRLNDGQWGVLNRKLGELVEQSGNTEKYPEAWARTRCEQLNRSKQCT